MTPRRSVRVTITIDVHDQPLLTTLIWARRTAHTLTNNLWTHGVLAHVARVNIDEHPPNQ
jgi:hypothetical protein